MRIKQHLVPLARIRGQPEGPRAELYVRQLELPPDTVEDQALLTPVKLEGFAPGKAQGHVRRARPDRALSGAPRADEFGDSRIAAGTPVRLQLGVQLPRGAAVTTGPARISLQRLAQSRLKRANLLGHRRWSVFNEHRHSSIILISVP